MAPSRLLSENPAANVRSIKGPSEFHGVRNGSIRCPSSSGDHGRIGQYVLVPDASFSRANEEIVVGHIAKLFGRSRQCAPERKTQKMPVGTHRSSVRGTPRQPSVAEKHRVDEI